AFIFSTFSLFAFTGEYSVVRISRFFLLFAPIVSGLAIYRLVNSYRWKQMSLDKSKRIKKMFIITIVMFIITVNSINTLNIYGSPRTVSSNLQVSKLEIYGYKWFSEHQESTIPVRVNLVDEYILRRFEDFNFGYATCPPAYKASATKQTASHFGYDKNESIIETFNFEDSY
ncbi:MAG: hypothetical protein H5T71_11295, partial [Chloroflexi bacterium]|nr:hypothetical protein [Chloroflexota bacterium]